MEFICIPFIIRILIWNFFCFVCCEKTNWIIIPSNFGYFVHDDVNPPNITSFTVSPTEFTEGVSTNIQITISITEACGTNACGGVSRYGIYLRPKSGNSCATCGSFSLVLGYFNGTTNEPPASAPSSVTQTFTLNIPSSFTGDDVDAWYSIQDTLGNVVYGGYLTIPRS